MARRKRKQEERSGPPGAPEWVVTFTDMISLLVTFFVLLMTFSSLEDYDALKIDSWLQSNKGIHKESAFSLAEVGAEDQIDASSVERGAHHPHARPPEELPESLEEMGQKATEEHREIDLNEVRDGIVIEFGEEESFAAGSVSVSDSLRESLVQIGEVLSHYPHMVVVEGFTDGHFRPTREHADAVALSLARAKAAARVLLAESGLAPEMVQLAGHGAAKPRADNLSPGGRLLNRRVQLRVLSISKMHARYLLQEREGERG